MLPGKGTQLSGHGEGDEEEIGGHEALGLSLDPLLALEELAMRATAMAAGMSIMPWRTRFLRCRIPWLHVTLF